MNSARKELYRSCLSGILLAASGHPRLAARAVRMASRLERGEMRSFTARLIMEERCGVSVGAYSYGSCFEVGSFAAGTQIGRYVSLARDVKAFRRNHPLAWLSTHPFFYNRKLGVVPEDQFPFKPLTIGHDAWVGERVIIAPGCGRIGVGAAVGAGAVVTRDVPDFALVAGVPARFIRLRFAEETCAKILASRWWESPIEQLAGHLAQFTTALSDQAQADFSFLKEKRP